jgi:hypothetical protein
MVAPALSGLAAYGDLRRFVSPEAFTQTMNFLAWHNRQKMTSMLEVWQVLVVAFVVEKYPIDNWLYPAIKSFFHQFKSDPPQTIDDCRSLADDLIKLLSGRN